MADDGVGGARHGVAEVGDGAHGEQHLVGAGDLGAGQPHERPRGRLDGEVAPSVLGAEGERLAELRERREQRASPAPSEATATTI